MKEINERPNVFEQQNIPKIINSVYRQMEKLLKKHEEGWARIKRSRKEWVCKSLFDESCCKAKNNYKICKSLSDEYSKNKGYAVLVMQDNTYIVIHLKVMWENRPRLKIGVSYILQTQYFNKLPRTVQEKIPVLKLLYPQECMRNMGINIGKKKIAYKSAHIYYVSDAELS